LDNLINLRVNGFWFCSFLIYRSNYSIWIWHNFPVKTLLLFFHHLWSWWSDHLLKRRFLNLARSPNYYSFWWGITSLICKKYLLMVLLFFIHTQIHWWRHLFRTCLKIKWGVFSSSSSWPRPWVALIISVMVMMVVMMVVMVLECYLFVLKLNHYWFIYHNLLLLRILWVTRSIIILKTLWIACRTSVRILLHLWKNWQCCFI